MSSGVSHYESLSTLMGLMSEAAALGQWNRLLDLETRCRQLVEDMKATDGQSAPDPVSLARKRDLIFKILADDAAIRRHTQPWMEQLNRAMTLTRREDQVRRAYAGS